MICIEGSMCKEARQHGACEEVKHYSVWLDHGNPGARDTGTCKGPDEKRLDHEGPHKPVGGIWT